MGVTVLFYKLFQFKDDLVAILKRYCCHSNVSTYLITPKNNHWSEMCPWSDIFRFICPLMLRGKPAVSPMSGAPTFDIEKKQKRGEFKDGVLHMIIFLRYCKLPQLF